MPLPMIHWSTFLGAVFLGLSDVLESVLFTGSGVNRQVSTRLEIATRLARRLGH